MSSAQANGAQGSARPRRGWRYTEGKNYALAAISEFLGTFLFLFFGFGGAQAAKLAYDPLKRNQADPSQAFQTVSFVLYISFAFGLSLGVNVWIFYRVSGGIFNPAVTLGFVLLRKTPVLMGVILTISQILGSILAAGLIEALLPGPLSVSTTLGPGMSVVQGLFLEMFLTFELIMAIHLLAVEKHRATFMAPLGIGFALFITHLTGVLFTGASVNPARSFGPAIVTRKFPGYHWIYWVGPGLGSLLATGFYKFLVFADYKTVNPGQDHDGKKPVKPVYTIGGGPDPVPDSTIEGEHNV